MVALTDVFWTAAFVLLYLGLAVAAVVLSVAVPYFAGRTVYERARTEDMENPAVVGFAAAFFSVLLGLFVVGIVIVYAL